MSSSSITPFLRDSCGASDDWEAKVTALRAASIEDGQDRLQHLSRLGDLLRYSPEHVAESIAIQQEILREIGSSPDPGFLARVQLRLAIALRYANRREEALEWFEHAQRTASAHDVRGVIDFIHQHRGKCLVEMGRLDDAKRELAMALQLRMSADVLNDELVESSREALRKVGELARLQRRA